jgi:hypothetical protein
MSKNVKTINLSDVFGPGTWSLILREEHIVNAFENRVLERIF